MTATFSGALWQLLQPVLHPRTVASFVTQSDDEDDGPSVEWDEEPAQPLDDRRFRGRLRQCFQSVPRIVLTRLAKTDDWATLSRSVALIGEQLALDATALRVLDFLDQHTLVEPLRVLLRECGGAPARVNLPRTGGPARTPSRDAARRP